MQPTQYEKNILKPISPQGNSSIKKVHNFLKRVHTKFLESSDLEWDQLMPLACYCYSIFPRSNGTEAPFSSCLAVSQWKAT